MDPVKTGKLIAGLRHEKGMTQRQLAERIHVSDRAVSKWERGAGCPDVSLLPALSRALSVNIERMLLGDLMPNSMDGGNMKRVKFYVCGNCGNIITATGDADVSCCGRKLAALLPKPAEAPHALTVTNMDDEFYITFDHPMEKSHFIRFVAYTGYDRVHFVRLYPEQGCELRMPQMRGWKLYFACSEHGLFVQ